MASSIQQQARALGDPTRYEIFDFVLGAERAVEVTELSEHLGLHHNAIRQHLAKLVDAGLLVERVATPRGRGRPPLTYTIDPGAESRWGPVGPFERLSLWLSEILRTGDEPREVGRRIGRQAASSGAPPGIVGVGQSSNSGAPPGIVGVGQSSNSSAPSSSNSSSQGCPDPVAALVDLMARHGFEPTVERRGETLEMTLRSCPFASVAAEDPATVCDLHLGMGEGLSEVTGRLVIEDLVAEDPRSGRCRLLFRSLPGCPA